MGCFDGAEVCKLVNTYILNQLQDTFQHHSVGLYRDDDLAVVKGLCGPEIERVKKRIIKMFKDCGLKITIKGDHHYSVNAKTNISRIFLSLLKKHFPKKNKPHKIFHKFSYSSMSNISSIITGHNKLLLHTKITKYGCNCKVKKNTCSLQNQCQTTNLIYQADVENEVNNEKKIYFKLAAKTFKECTTKTLSC